MDLSPYKEFRVMYEGKHWNCIEQFCQALKFSNNPNIARSIMRASHGLMARKIGHENIQLIRENYYEILETYMESFLTSVCDQVPEFLDTLQHTAEIPDYFVLDEKLNNLYKTSLLNIRGDYIFDDVSTYELPEPTVEQKNIINSISTHNIKVDAVAGSGKTTLSLLIGKKYLTKKILLLTYNRFLKEDTREKIRLLDIKNMEAHSFHSYMYHYYTDSGYTDSEMLEVLKTNTQSMNNEKYDIIIVDECQDMTNTYCKFVQKIIIDNGSKNTWLCFVGDTWQHIYQFNYADSRYLLKADTVFVKTRPYKTCPLSVSFRLTGRMCKFINHNVLHSERFHTMKSDGAKVKYTEIKPYAVSSYLIPRICYYLSLGYKYDDFFIIAPSIRSKKVAIRTLANQLSIKYNIPIYVPVSDDEKISSEVSKNKIIFSTFHQTKGLERKIVFVYCFSSEYFEHYGKNSDPDVCPNVLYVAITRGIDHLELIKSKKYEKLNFLIDPNQIQISESQKIKKTDKKTNKKEYGVSSLLRYVPSDLIEQCMNYLTKTLVRRKSRMIKIRGVTKINDAHSESVSEINGTAIPAYYEYKTTGQMSIRENIKKPLTINRLLWYATSYCAKMSGYWHKLNQIKYYSWITEKQRDRCVNRLSRIIKPGAKFEIEVSNQIEGHDIYGVMDCVYNNDIYEFKCVTELTKINCLQLAIYKYLSDDQHENCYLYNILTDEMYRIEISDEFVEVIKILINHKVSDEEISDEIFIQNAIFHPDAMDDWLAEDINQALLNDV